VRADNSNLPPDDRKALVERIFIKSPRFLRARGMISRCHQHSKISAEPECLLITGWQGTGKTTLYKNYARGFPRRVTDEGTEVPVLATTIPVPATVKSLATQLLHAMGDPKAEKGSSTSQTLRLLGLAEDCGVELIILDEFQHFIDRDSNSILEEAADWLKNLINNSEKPVVLLGMPYCDIILRANAQLERRFTMRVSLEPFGWEEKIKRDEFKTFLSHLDAKLPLPERSNLSLHETAFRLYCATNGYVGYLMKLIRGAAHFAIERSCARIDLDLLAEAYEERLVARASARANPFTADVAKLVAQPFDEWEMSRSKLKRLLKGMSDR
jgi:Cdc6-like AAA superfamily ATPase